MFSGVYRQSFRRCSLIVDYLFLKIPPRPSGLGIAQDGLSQLFLSSSGRQMTPFFYGRIPPVFELLLRALAWKYYVFFSAKKGSRIGGNSSNP